MNWKNLLFGILFFSHTFFLISCTLEATRSLFNTSDLSATLFFSEKDVGGYGSLTGNLQVGLSAKTIYPENPVSLSGFGSPLRRLIPPDLANIGNGAMYCKPYQNIVKQPRIKTLLFKGKNNNSDAYYLIISYDLVAISPDFNIKILNSLKDKFPNLNLSHANVQMIATHTHSGPAGLTENPFWAVAICDRFNPSLYNIVKSQTISAVSEAISNLNSIQSQDIADTKLEGYNVTRFHGMEVDQKSYFINFKDINSNSIGCFQIFSAHATWYGMDDLTFSSDFAGYVEEELQIKTKANTCIYFNGTVGNASVVIPKDKDSFAYYFTNDILSKATSNILPPTGLGYGTIFIKLPGFQINFSGCGFDFGWIPQSFIENLFSIRSSDITNNITKISWFSLNGTYFFMFPGEPLFDTKNDLQKVISQQFPNIQSFYILSTANDYTGYLMTSDNYSKTTVETCSTLHGPSTSTAILNGFMKGIQESGQ